MNTFILEYTEKNVIIQSLIMDHCQIHINRSEKSISSLKCSFVNKAFVFKHRHKLIVYFYSSWLRIIVTMMWLAESDESTTLAILSHVIFHACFQYRFVQVTLYYVPMLGNSDFSQSDLRMSRTNILCHQTIFALMEWQFFIKSEIFAYLYNVMLHGT